MAATTGTLSSPGIGSNLDVNSIISKLMQIEAAPLNRLEDKKSSYEAKISALGSIKSALSSMQTAMTGLGYGTDFLATTASSSDTSIVKVSGTSGATPGDHSIVVSNLAKSQTLVATGQTDSTAAIGSGSSTTITIDLGTTSGSTFTPNGSGSFNVVIDSSNNTLEGIRDAINAANKGVTASIVNDGTSSPYRLVLTSSDTGADQSMQIQVSGDATLTSLLNYDPVSGTKNLTETVTALDASFTVDGISFSKSSNTVTDAIDGVTLDLVSEAPATTLTVSVSQDIDSIKQSITDFVNGFNELVKQIKTQTDSGVDSGKKGALASDSLTRYIETSIVAELNTSPSSVSGSTYTTLSSIGISFQKDGTLAVDDATLTTALETDSSNVKALFSASDGYGARLNDVLSELVGSGGTIDSRTNIYSDYIDNLDNQMTTVQASLDRTEKRLRAQFTSLDVLVGQMNITSNYLSQQIANLSGKLG
jgi:flagellar hook-associated protein 2